MLRDRGSERETEYLASEESTNEFYFLHRFLGYKSTFLRIVTLNLLKKRPDLLNYNVQNEIIKIITKY